jgi:formamidopyrimidine-DNA glycosylase
VPEIPDIEAYLEALRPRIVGEELRDVRLVNLFLLRSVDPPLSAVAGRRVVDVRRLGKRIVFALEDDYALVLHLMIAGRLHWKSVDAAVPKGRGLAAFDFPTGTLVVTEAGKTRRASLHVVRGPEALAELDPGGLEVAGADLPAFRAAMERENHTLKRALTDPHILSGIGNAYSDEILHRARLSPLKQTKDLSAGEWARLHDATRDTLATWTERLRAEARAAFPEKVTAFRPDMAAHGRFGQPCPVCGTAIQRISYAANESDYCPRCQTEGRVLADRALSRLLKNEWPRTIEELEAKPGLRGGRPAGEG